MTDDVLAANDELARVARRYFEHIESMPLPASVVHATRFDDTRAPRPRVLRAAPVLGFVAVAAAVALAVIGLHH
jgi:hypothetical protein